MTILPITFLLLITSIVVAVSFQPNNHHKLSDTTSARYQTPVNSSMSPLDINIAIVGGGQVGTILARKLLESKKFASVKIAARNPEKTRKEIDEKKLDIEVGIMSNVLSKSEVVILAIGGLYSDEEIKQFCNSLGDTSHKVIIDATNPLGRVVDGLPVRTWEEGISSGEKLQLYMPRAKVYKSFNTVGLEHMRESLGKDMLIAGDPDPSYKLLAEEVVRGVGFKPFYVGPIRYARNLEAMAELWIHMAIPGLAGRDTGRNFWWSVSGDPTIQ